MSMAGTELHLSSRRSAWGETVVKGQIVLLSLRRIVYLTGVSLSLNMSDSGENVCARDPVEHSFSPAGVCLFNFI
jgi:hypothetical protein